MNRRSPNELIVRHSDLILAGLVGLVLVLMVLRVPPAFLDWAIALNIALSAVMLMAALYLRTPARFAAFPAVLLIVTLFRLGLNISSTRLILLEADAGRIIDTFGRFVVGGNFVVGAVVFLLLVIVQFVVISQGSKRVARVAARFSLDAMQGKQTAIDADLQRGEITGAEASRRRLELQKESRLYGAMDGSMNFVEGDAIAGLVISAVNIVAGLIVGVTQQGMEMGEAAQTYSILTIGDGLVSQIPALLLGLSAALIVSRVPDDTADEEGSLGRDVSTQILGFGRAFLPVGVVMAAFALSSPFTGFPPLPFLALSLISFGLFTMVVRQAKVAAAEARTAVAPGMSDGTGAGAEPGSAEAGADLATGGPAAPMDPRQIRILHGADGARIAERMGGYLPKIAERVRSSTGVKVPPAQCEQVRSTSVDGDAMGGPRFLVKSGRELLGVTELPRPNFQVVLMAPDRVSKLLPDVSGTELLPFRMPGYGTLVTQLSAASGRLAGAQGLPVLGPVQVLADHVELLMRTSLHRRQNYVQYEALLAAVQKSAKSLWNAVHATGHSSAHVARLFRHLLEEEINVVLEQSDVLEAIATSQSDGKDEMRLLESIRFAIRGRICASFAREGAVIEYYALEPAYEAAIVGCYSREFGGERISVSTEMLEPLVAACDVAHHRRHGTRPIILCSARNRRLVRQVVSYLYPAYLCLSEQELAPGYGRHRLGAVSADAPVTV